MRSVAALILLAAASVASAAEPVAKARVATYPGRGYVPYTYPAVGSCPCGEDGCFHPGRYYACDDGYEKSFWRRWARAHFCGGSMLEGVPCRCVSPPGRTVLVPARSSQPAVTPALEPDSEPGAPSEPAETDSEKTAPQPEAT